MSNLATARRRAEEVRTPKQAARLYNDVNHELELTPDEDLYKEGEAALDVLATNFPGVDQQAREIETPPNLSRRAGSTLSTPRARGSHTSGRSRPSQRAPSQRRTGGARTPPETSSARDTAGRAAGAAAGAIGDAFDTSWGSLALQLMVWGMGLSIVYLLLTHDKAVSKLALGASNTARAVISPHTDPLNPGRTLK